MKFFSPGFAACLSATVLSLLWFLLSGNEFSATSAWTHAGLAASMCLCVRALWMAARQRQDRPLYAVSVATLSFWMAFALVGMLVRSDIVVEIMLFGGVMALVHGWCMAALAICSRDDAVRRYVFALAYGVALGAFYPATMGLAIRRWAEVGQLFALAHSKAYPWGCLVCFLCGMAALLLLRALWWLARKSLRPLVDRAGRGRAKAQ